MSIIGRFAKHPFDLLVSWYRKRFGRSAEKTHLEVERKYRLSPEEVSFLPEKIRSLGFVPASTVSMTDRFLPTAGEGDMVRVRDESESGAKRTLLTFKQWVGTQDGGRERQECEGQVGKLGRRLLLVLGCLVRGSRLLSFSKERQLFDGSLGGRTVVVSIDNVGGLGDYSGFYLEVELLVPLAGDVSSAREAIFGLVVTLLGEEREMVKLSYQDMLKLSLSQARIS